MTTKRSKTLLACLIACVLTASTAVAHPPAEESEESTLVAPIFLLTDDEGPALGHDLRDGNEDTIGVWFEGGSPLLPYPQQREPAHIEFDRLLGSDQLLVAPDEVPAFFALAWGYENYDPVYQLLGDRQQPAASVAVDLSVGCVSYETLRYELPADYGQKIIEDVFVTPSAHHEQHSGSAGGSAGGGFHPQEGPGGHEHMEAKQIEACDAPSSHDVTLAVTIEPIFQDSITSIQGEFVWVELGLAGSSGVLLERAPPVDVMVLEDESVVAAGSAQAAEAESAAAQPDDTIAVPGPGLAWVLPALGVGALLRRRD